MHKQHQAMVKRRSAWWWYPASVENEHPSIRRSRPMSNRSVERHWTRVPWRLAASLNMVLGPQQKLKNTGWFAAPASCCNCDYPATTSRNEQLSSPVCAPTPTIPCKNMLLKLGLTSWIFAPTIRRNLGQLSGSLSVQYNQSVLFCRVPNIY